MKFLDVLENVFAEHSERNAFRIGTSFYTYRELAQAISNIRSEIISTIGEKEINIGLVLNDDLETYASIFACWMEGKAYVPISPSTPLDRNVNIIGQSDIQTIIDSSSNITFSTYRCIESKKLKDTSINLVPKEIEQQDLAYIFFTSGTTGVPKGVPITRANLDGFIDAFWDMGYYEVTEKDRCLQMFELTFDLSVMSYLVPLLKGACVYTIPKDKIKYSYIYELMEDHELTIALMVPSMLSYLRPYFEEIHSESLKYSLFCGEALSLDITQEWSKCVPNATILNVYGPTEDTIFCTHYEYLRTEENKSHNGVLCIGKSMKDNLAVIVDKENNILELGQGELCLGGVQLTPGYWKNEKKNKEVFFYQQYKGKLTRFYRTGDLCTVDKDGDIMYSGRIDFQAKVQGFRVELSEIEFFVRKELEKKNAVVVAFTNKLGNTEIGLTIESQKIDTTSLLERLSGNLPNYMLPTQIKFIEKIPLNTNGKTNRKVLKQLFEV